MKLTKVASNNNNGPPEAPGLKISIFGQKTTKFDTPKICIFGQFVQNIGSSDPFGAMPNKEKKQCEWGA